MDPFGWMSPPDPDSLDRRGTVDASLLPSPWSLTESPTHNSMVLDVPTTYSLPDHECPGSLPSGERLHPELLVSSNTGSRLPRRHSPGPSLGLQIERKSIKASPSPPPPSPPPQSRRVHLPSPLVSNSLPSPWSCPPSPSPSTASLLPYDSYTLDTTSTHQQQSAQTWSSLHSSLPPSTDSRFAFAPIVARAHPSPTDGAKMTKPKQSGSRSSKSRPTANANHGVPLNCAICPKAPTFSDISHLLTHISSKGHLASRHKLSILSQNDDAARYQLHAFDNWYEVHHIDGLLAERLAQKNIKQAAKARKQRDTVGLRAPSPVRIDSMQNLEPSFRAPAVPEMHGSAFTPGGRHWDLDPSYATPSANRAVPNFARADTPGSSYSPNSIATPPGKDSSKKKKSSSAAELKGDIWEGMGIFDTATPGDKKMRNQKKAPTNIQAMEASSRNTRPDEISYTENWDFRKNRDLTGDEPLSCDSSPTAPTPKKKRVRNLKVLKNLSTNAPRLRNAQGKGSARAFSPEKRSAFTRNMDDRLPGHLHQLGPVPMLNPLSMNSRFQPSHDEEEEFRLAMNVISKGSKRTFSVFRDTQVAEASPGGTESPLLEDDRFKLDAPPNFASDVRSAISPTPVVRPAASRAMNINISNGRRSPSYITPAQLNTQNSNPLFSNFGQQDHSSFGPYSHEAPLFNGQSGIFPGNRYGQPHHFPNGYMGSPFEPSRHGSYANDAPPNYGPYSNHGLQPMFLQDPAEEGKRRGH